MFKKLIISILILFCSFLSGKSQTTYFSNRYPVVNHWGGGSYNVIENANGYFSITTPISYTTVRQNLVVIQTDIEGNVLSEKIYGDTIYSYFMGLQGSLQRVSTGGYVMFGTKYSNKNYALLYRFNDLGDTLWTKELGDNSSLEYVGHQVKETDDGGYICIGTISGSNPIWIIKTDSLGNKEWERTYGSSNWDWPTSIAVCNDGGYIFTAASKAGGIGLPKDNIRIMKVDTAGNVVFNHFFGGIEDDNSWSIIQTQDGGYLFGGNYTFEDPGCSCLKSNPYVIKMDSLGDTLWTKKYGPAMSNATVLNMHELDDESIILCGLTRKEQIIGGDYREQGLVFKITKDGDSLFYNLYRLLSSNSSHQLRDIKPASDGGFICAGYIVPRSPDTGTQDMWLLKLDSNGCADTTCALTVSINDNLEAPFGNLEDSFNVYPNPNQGNFTLDYFLDDNWAQVHIIDLTGTIVYNKTLTNKKGKLKLITNLPGGFYLVVLKNKDHKILYQTKVGVIY
jgi:hypothetical protein